MYHLNDTVELKHNLDIDNGLCIGLRGVIIDFVYQLDNDGDTTKIQLKEYVVKFESIEDSQHVLLNYIVLPKYNDWHNQGRG